MMAYHPFTRTYESIATKQELKEMFNCPVYESWKAVPKDLFTAEKLSYEKIIITNATTVDGIVMNQKFGAFKRLYKKPNS